MLTPYKVPPRRDWASFSAAGVVLQYDANNPLFQQGIAAVARFIEQALIVRTTNIVANRPPITMGYCPGVVEPSESYTEGDETR